MNRTEPPLANLRPPTTPEEMDHLVESARRASEFMKALSHETRLLILCLLVDGEKSVTELEQTLAMPQAAVSQQLARLRFDRLVSTRRDGRVIYYSIAGDEVSRIVGALHDLFCSGTADGAAAAGDAPAADET